jgi:hypothetical protein
MFWRCIPTTYCVVSLKKLTAASMSSSVSRETFKANFSLMICQKSSQFVYLLLKLGCSLCSATCC